MLKLIGVIILAELLEHVIEAAFGWIRMQFRKEFTVVR